MQDAPGLVLRDIHSATAPPWWPPAPGWWLVAGLLLLVAAAIGIHAWRRRRRRHAIARLFDDTVAGAESPAGQVAAISGLLRRAARRRDPGADRLQGDAWLAFLDEGAKQPLFGRGLGDALLEGAYRRDVDAADVERLGRAARIRFLEWMAAK